MNPLTLQFVALARHQGLLRNAEQARRALLARPAPPVIVQLPVSSTPCLTC
ncbi:MULTISPECIES: hypothetical protein [Deinococcus]|uniref:Uncharacterized protein n=1 Tax=Deinococcus daejeonensis TaxID=1007098 RepID=A0ABQ2JE78_9DEIO|nr:MULTISPECIES: hypothetical protein [Deinococcus]GGN44684.1 hypothetical protein GCM10010842_33500 [Deinococcus daejeonensis]